MVSRLSTNLGIYIYFSPLLTSGWQIVANRSLGLHGWGLMSLIRLQYTASKLTYCTRTNNVHCFRKMTTLYFLLFLCSTNLSEPSSNWGLFLLKGSSSSSLSPSACWHWINKIFTESKVVYWFTLLVYWFIFVYDWENIFACATCSKDEAISLKNFVRLKEYDRRINQNCIQRTLENCF